LSNLKIGGSVKVPRKTTSKIAYAGFILVLIGGIIVLLFGLFDLLAVGVRIFRDISFLGFLTGTVRSLSQIVIGTVCIIGSRFVSNLLWAIVLLILGLIAGTIGGTLIVIGAILGLVSVLIKSAPR
jgi:hypothetical protein